jgi:hypothetical protein
VVSSGDGWAEIDASGVRLRLVEASTPEHRSALRFQSPAVEDGVAALVAAGATLVHPPTRTPAQELIGVVRDPDGHTLTVWRPLSEDEYDFVPPLPKKTTWQPDADALLRSLLKRVPALFRMIARYRVTRLAEQLAAGTRTVSREQVIRAYILASPRITRERNRQPLIDHGIDVDRYREDWEAD